MTVRASYLAQAYEMGVEGAAPLAFESLDLRHLPDWQSRIWSIGAGLVAPLFQGGRLVASTKAADRTRSG